MRFVAFLSVVFLVPTAAAAATRSAHVSVSSLSPVTVRGSSFKPGERVRVTLSADGGTHAKTVTAGVRGGLKATFVGVSIGSCEAYAVRAKGNRGSTAFLKVIPECAPPGPADVKYPVDPVPKKR